MFDLLLMLWDGAGVPFFPISIFFLNLGFDFKHAVNPTIFSAVFVVLVPFLLVFDCIGS